jgi:copper transport protein
LVSAKVLLFLSLVSLAVWNRLRLFPALTAEISEAADRLRRSIRIEAIIGALVLGVTAVLTSTPPPRSIPYAPEVAVRQHLHSRNLIAELEVVPGRAGHNTMRVGLRSTTGDRLTPREVSAELSMPQYGIGPIRRRLVWNSSVASWTIEGSELSVPGRWTLRFAVLVSDFEEISFETEIEVR